MNLSTPKPNTPAPCPKGSKTFQPTGTGKFMSAHAPACIFTAFGRGRSLPKMDATRVPGRFLGPHWRAASTPAKRPGFYRTIQMAVAAAITRDQVAEISKHVRYDESSGQLLWVYTHPGARTCAGEVAGRPRFRRGAISYQYVGINGQGLMAHRVVWALVHGELSGDLAIDHIDGNVQNNKLTNLRAVPLRTNSENMRQARKDSSTGLLGVHYDKSRCKYLSSIRIDGRSIYLGRWDSEIEAYASYLTAKRLLHAGCTI